MKLSQTLSSYHLAPHLLALLFATCSRPLRPYLSETALSDTDKAIVVACDGLWDVVSDEECKELLDELVEKDGVRKEDVAQHLITEALKRGSTDNISVVVCWL